MWLSSFSPSPMIYKLNSRASPFGIYYLTSALASGSYTILPTAPRASYLTSPSLSWSKVWSSRKPCSLKHFTSKESCKLNAISTRVCCERTPPILKLPPFALSFVATSCPFISLITLTGNFLARFLQLSVALLEINWLESVTFRRQSLAISFCSFSVKLKLFM